MAGSSSESENVKTFLRIRPLNQQEIQNNVKCCLHALGSKEVLVKNRDEKTFKVDEVFPENTQQTTVFEQVAKPLVKKILSGYTCTVFAYGQRDSGKTFSLYGVDTQDSSFQSDIQAGIIPRFFQNLFEECCLDKLESSLRVSLIEIYNEDIYDLLSFSDSDSKIRLYEDIKEKGIVKVYGVEEELVKNKRELNSLLQRALKKKEATIPMAAIPKGASHTLLMATMQIRETNECGEDFMKIGKINFIDLSASDYATAVNDKKNSLLHLGRVVRALVDRLRHVPFRETKLTRIVQESLGGHSYTTFLGTLSPLKAHVEETTQTLEFFNKVKHIVNIPKVNKSISKEAMIAEYTKEIEKLKQELRDSQLGNGIYLDEENYNKYLDETNALKSKVSEHIKKSREIQDHIGEMERQRNMVIESFETVSKTIQEVTYNLKVTAQELEGKQDEFKSTEEKIERNKGKQEYILEKVETLQHIIYSTLGNKDLLYHKLEVLYKKSKNNFHYMNLVYEELDSQIKQIHDGLQEVGSKNNSMTEQILQTLEERHSELTKHEENQQGVKKKLIREVDAMKLKLRNIKPIPAETTTKVRQKIIQNYQQLCTECKDLSKRIYSEDIRNIITLNVEFARSTKLDDVKQMCDDLFKFVEEEIERFITSLNILSNCCNNLFKEMEDSMKFFDSNLEGTEQIFHSWESLLRGKLQMVYKLFDEIQEMSNAKCIEITNSYKKTKLKIDEVNQTRDEVMKVASKGCETFVNEQELLANKIRNSLADINKVTKKKEEEHCLRKTEVTATIHNTRMKINDAIMRMEASAEETCQNTESDISQHIEEFTLINSNDSYIKERLQEISVLEHHSKDSNTHCEEFLKRKSEITEKLSRDLGGVHDSFFGLIDEKSTRLSNMLEDISKNYEPVTHEGDTPQKTDRFYPQIQLPQTPDCKRNIIQEMKEET